MSFHFFFYSHQIRILSFELHVSDFYQPRGCLKELSKNERYNKQLFALALHIYLSLLTDFASELDS